MQLTDSREIAATPEIVWAAILDPEVLKQCVPGCQEMTGSPEEGFEAKVVQKVGPVKATFKGSVTLSDMQPPESLTLTGEGKGGAAADLLDRPLPGIEDRLDLKPQGDPASDLRARLGFG